MSDELTERRLEKLRRLRDLGLEPYGGRYERSHSTAGVRERFDELAASETQVSIAGRVMSVRKHGKSWFADIVDMSGKLQLYVRMDTLDEKTREVVQLMDIGDYVGVAGPVFKTRTGEITVQAKDIRVLSKSLRPLPEKWHGLKDVETRYRKRYLDLIFNAESRKVFETRNRVIRRIREFLGERGYVEVETPILQPRAGGAAGKPFRTRADMLDTDLYLRIAPELYLKRLIVGGQEKVYELNRSFRNEGLSPKHNPEFTMLEIYRAYADYEDMMLLTEEIVRDVAKNVTGSLQVEYRGKKIDLGSAWKRVPFSEAMRERFGVDIREEGLENLKKKLKEEGITVDAEKLSRTQVINLLADLLASENPCFVTDYPAEFCPLAKRKREDPGFTERFELYMRGIEIANAYSELNDPVEQKQRFLEQARGREEKVDSDYVEALEYGMPPAAGLGIGVDRLVMILTGSPSIRDVILFPQMKPRE